MILRFTLSVAQRRNKVQTDRHKDRPVCCPRQNRAIHGETPGGFSLQTAWNGFEVLSADWLRSKSTFFRARRCLAPAEIMIRLRSHIPFPSSAVSVPVVSGLSFAMA